MPDTHDPAKSLYSDHNGRAQEHIREAAQLLGEVVSKFTGRQQWGTQRFQMTVSALALLNHAWALTRAAINEGATTCAVEPIQGTVSDVMSRDFLQAVARIVGTNPDTMLGAMSPRAGCADPRMIRTIGYQPPTEVFKPSKSSRKRAKAK